MTRGQKRLHLIAWLLMGPLMALLLLAAVLLRPDVPANQSLPAFAGEEDAR